jgi:hypothetical protein
VNKTNCSVANAPQQEEKGKGRNKQQSFTKSSLFRRKSRNTTVWLSDMTMVAKIFIKQP